MILPIRIWPDEVLRGPADEVTEFGPELAELADDMLETMYAAPGRGLAAPQVGVSKRVFVMDVAWKEGEAQPRVLVNPKISRPSRKKSVNSEGCLSLPGFSLAVKRPARIDLSWQDVEGALHFETLEGFDAICAQHELDHLNGVLTIDRIADEVRVEIEPLLAALEARA